MEALLKQLRELPKRFLALSPNVRRLCIVGLVALLGIAAAVTFFTSKSDNYQYVFTNLSPEDSSEASAALQTAKIPFRLEAAGAALAVPASQVYEARLLLATAGLPRGGGVGFELFDRGDLGVSEFTQRVNLRRATEGELSRTIGRLTEVRSARVHLTLPEKGLFRDDERKASAAVVLNLFPGRTVGERELAGIRHLVASAVAGLTPQAVTIVDSRGTVLSTEPSWADTANRYAQKLEQDLERRVVSLLESAVGAGAVVARITAALDTSEIDRQAEIFDPEATALRSERKVAQSQNQDSGKGAIAGAAANQPLEQPSSPGGSTANSRGSSLLEDEIRNFETSKTVTKTVTKAPRVQRLSVAILVDGVKGKARSAEELNRLGELAKRAVGYDEKRGDQLEITSTLFHSLPSESAPQPVIKTWNNLHYALLGAGVLLFLLITGGAALAMRAKKRREQHPSLNDILTPGAKVGEIMAAQASQQLPALAGSAPALEAPKVEVSIQERARILAAKDPARAAHLLKAWMAADIQNEEPIHG
jgi:flagellar M-ring protein FliF